MLYILAEKRQTPNLCEHGHMQNYKQVVLFQNNLKNDRINVSDYFTA